MSQELALLLAIGNQLHYQSQLLYYLATNTGQANNPQVAALTAKLKYHTDTLQEALTAARQP